MAGGDSGGLEAGDNLRNGLRRLGVAGLRAALFQAYAAAPAAYERLAIEYLHWLWRVDRSEAIAEAAWLDTCSPPDWPVDFHGRIRKERIRRLAWFGEYQKASTLLASLPAAARDEIADLEALLDDCRVLAEAKDPASAIQPARRQQRFPRSDRPRILYFAHHALPFHHNGYAHRTHSLVKALSCRGLDIAVATRLGFPIDRETRQRPPRSLSPTAEIDGIRYIFSPSARENLRVMAPMAYMRAAAERLAELISRERIDLVHAASNHVCGLVAVAAARACGIPALYEARGAWEVTRASRDPIFGGSDAFGLDLRLERAAAAGADRFLAINRAVGERFALDPCTGSIRPFGIVPNGIDVGAVPDPVDRQRIRRDLGLPADAFVAGYAGSIVDYEGLDLLIEAIAQLRHGGRLVHLLIVGDGIAKPFVEAIARTQGVADIAKFVGRVERMLLPAYYAAMDVVCIPRLAWPVCELVTPLKPFEAMAAGLPVIASSVAPLREAISSTGGGVVFEKENVSSLVEVLRSALSGPEHFAAMGRRGRETVVRTRQWDAVVQPILVAYDELLGEAS